MKLPTYRIALTKRAHGWIRECFSKVFKLDTTSTPKDISGAWYRFTEVFRGYQRGFKKDYHTYVTDRYGVSCARAELTPCPISCIATFVHFQTHITDQSATDPDDVYKGGQFLDDDGDEGESQELDTSMHSVSSVADHLVSPWCSFSWKYSKCFQ